MSVKKRYDIFIYTTLILAVVCIALGLKDNFTSNAVKTDTVEKNTSTDPLEKTNKRLIILSYLKKVSMGEIINDNITPEMMSTWYKYDIGNITYKKTIGDNTFQYLVEILIYNQAAEIPTSEGRLEGTEYIASTILFNIAFDGEEGSYLVDSIRIP